MLLYSGFLSTLAERASVSVWATSIHHGRNRHIWDNSPAVAEEFPAILPYREIPHNYLRRLNEFVWDYRQRPASRLSMFRHMKSSAQKPSVRALRIPARVLAWLRLETWLEGRLERLLLGYPRSPEAIERLRSDPPDLVVTTGPHRFEEPAAAAAAKMLGIPTLAFITSWDNISTKNRPVFNYDGYIVWSETMKNELHYFYPRSRGVASYVVGAPQFDVFFDRQFYWTRERFCAAHRLAPEKPIILYALGSPNFLPEHDSALFLAERVARGDLGDVQLLIRPHPIHDNAEEDRLFERFAPHVVVQRTSDVGAAVNLRSQDTEQIADWINTFRHADVVVNLSSTAAIDAAIFDRPVVNLDFDPQPGRPRQALVKDVNHLWTHFKPVAESGGVWLVNDFQEMVSAVTTYLRNPALHRPQRRWIAEYVCGYLDGQSGARMARSILSHLEFGPDPLPVSMPFNNRKSTLGARNGPIGFADRSG
jgi:hypothetical protein